MKTLLLVNRSVVVAVVVAVVVVVSVFVSQPVS